MDFDIKKAITQTKTSLADVNKILNTILNDIKTKSQINKNK